MRLSSTHNLQWILPLILGLTLLFAACDNTTQGGTALSSSNVPDSMHVTRVSTQPKNHIIPLDITIHDSTQVQCIYNAALALPKFPSTIKHCPVDFGIQYHIDFLQHTKHMQQVVLDANGCRKLYIDKGDVRQTNDAFWSLLAQVAGIPTSQLHAHPL